MGLLGESVEQHKSALKLSDALLQADVFPAEELRI